MFVSSPIKIGAVSATDDGVVPDARILPEVDVAEDNRPLRNESSRIDHAKRSKE